MNISPITLGTAQLTIPYGIVNHSSKLSKQSAFMLLENALQNGISTWDTSPAYGQSERIIGDYLNKNTAANVIICSKLPSIVKQYGKKIRTKTLNNIVSENIDLSLRALRREKIDCYYIHDEQDFITFGSELMHSLTECINKGKIDNIGISVYSPKIATLALQKKEINLIQLPLNIFDRRFEMHIKEASTKNVEIFVRSVYLQGLFFIAPSICRKKVPLAFQPLKKLLEISINYELSIAEIAFAYVRSINGITTMVLGMENLQQLYKNVGLLDAPKLPIELTNEINRAFSDIPTEVLNPSRWKN